MNTYKKALQILSNALFYWEPISVTSKTPNVHDLFGVNNNKKKRHTPPKSKFVK